MANHYEWAEVLPNECPPEEANPTDGTYYRLGSNPPIEGDFFSHRKLFPLKAFNTTECRAMSLSIFNDIDSIKKLRALPTMKSKNNSIIKLNLYPENGVILQTGKDLNHFSWWKSLDFDLTQCAIVL